MKEKLALACVLASLIAGVFANSSHAIDVNSMVGAWLFDEGVGNLAKDSSKIGNHGTIHDAKWTGGKFGGALEFSGKEWVEVPDAPDLNPTDKMSISVWIYLKEPAEPWEGVVGKRMRASWVSWCNSCRMRIHTCAGARRMPLEAWRLWMRECWIPSRLSARITGDTTILRQIRRTRDVR